MIELAPGAAVGGGRYTLERMLGSGGMATVWLAHDDRLDRPVAVKLLSDVLALDPSYVERFRREARIAAQLWHPNLVPVYDYNVDEGRPLLVMEVIHGPTLAELLRGGSEFRLDPVQLGSELLSALAHIHAAGVVHRDIKPANVLIGRDGRTRLTDFGIAAPTGATRLTTQGGVIGTAGYMAPEVAAGERATPRSDLYSCGVLLEACHKRRRVRDRRLGRLIARLTAEDPERRLQSADEALAFIDGATNGKGPRPTRARTRPSSTAPTAVAPKRLRVAARPRPDALDEIAAKTRARAGRVLEHPLQATVAGFVAGLVLLAIALALFSSGSAPRKAPARPARSAAAPPAPTASLSAQLDALERDLNAAAR